MAYKSSLCKVIPSLYHSLLNYITDLYIKGLLNGSSEHNSIGRDTAVCGILGLGYEPQISHLFT